MYIYYNTNESGKKGEKTGPADGKSGAEKEGGAPKNEGVYYVEAKFGNNDEAVIEKKFTITAHTHGGNWSYKKNGETVEAQCGKEGCEGISITLEAQECEAGEEYSGASVKGPEGTELPEEIKPDYIYYNTNESGEKGEKTGLADDKSGAKEEGGAPWNAGRYYVEAVFENEKEGDKVALEKAFTVKKIKQSIDALKVNMKSYIYDAKEIEEPSLSNSDLLNEKPNIEFHYYKDGEGIEKSQKWMTNHTFASLDAGNYHIYAKIGETANYEECSIDAVPFTVEKAVQADITVTMKNYERGGKSIPSINKPDTIKEDAAITFYYNTTGDTSGGTLWAENDSSKIAAGNYYIYAVLGETKNYKEYRTKAVGFTVYAGHSMGKGVVTKKRTDSSEGELTYACGHGCGYTKKLPLPKKVVTVELGKKAKIISDISACTMKLPNASKYKKYLTLDAKKGVIKTKKYYKVKLKKSIPVNVVVDGVTYKVNVKVKIPTPDIKISKRTTPMSDGSKAYKYSFKYDIKGADRITVRMKKGGTKKLNKEFDYYISKPKSNKMSYVLFSKKTLKKLKNKVTFKITAHFGKNKLELPPITR